MRTATPGHDEFWKFLGPYGWSRGYMGDDGKPAKPGLIPSLATSIEQKTILARDARRRGRGRAVLPRPARRRAPHDLPPPARRSVQEGRRADGPLHRRGRPARAADAAVASLGSKSSRARRDVHHSRSRCGQRRLRWTVMSDDPTAAGQARSCARWPAAVVVATRRRHPEPPTAPRAPQPTPKPSAHRRRRRRQPGAGDRRGRRGAARAVAVPEGGRRPPVERPRRAVVAVRAGDVRAARPAAVGAQARRT